MWHRCGTGVAQVLILLTFSGTGVAQVCSLLVSFIFCGTSVVLRRYHVRLLIPMRSQGLVLVRELVSYSSRVRYCEPFLLAMATHPFVLSDPDDFPWLDFQSSSATQVNRINGWLNLSHPIPIPTTFTDTHAFPWLGLQGTITSARTAHFLVKHMRSPKCGVGQLRTGLETFGRGG